MSNSEDIDQFFASNPKAEKRTFDKLPVLKNPTTDEITQALYSKIPKWMLAAMAAMGKESQAIEELTELTAEAFKQGYNMGVNDTMNQIRKILAKAKVDPK